MEARTKIRRKIRTGVKISVSGGSSSRGNLGPGSGCGAFAVVCGTRRRPPNVFCSCDLKILIFLFAKDGEIDDRTTSLNFARFNGVLISTSTPVRGHVRYDGSHMFFMSFRFSSCPVRQAGNALEETEHHSSQHCKTRKAARIQKMLFENFH